MWLVWDYGEKTGLKGWKGLSWGMVSVNFAVAKISFAEEMCGGSSLSACRTTDCDVLRFCRRNGSLQCRLEQKKLLSFFYLQNFAI
jgi:hypothetical protein